ncbi:MAG: PEP-CTERM sorting domain-containing protein [Thiobacillus sp.]
MRVFPVVSVLLCMSALPFAAQAVSVSELPATIQSCITAGSCVVNYSGAYDSGTASAFEMVDLPSGKWNWLVRYNLVSPSGQTVIGGGLNTAYSGYLWMQVASNYSAAETAHPVTLFLDKVTPVPGSIFGQGGDLSYFMSTADLLAGGAYNTTSYVSYEPDGIVSEGGLSGDILLCLAVGCQTNVQLNLLQLNYQSFGSAGVSMTGFEASDTRGLVYSQNSSYLTGDPHTDYSATQVFYITAVPEPETFWMLGLGLVSVAIAVRRRRS